MFLIAAIVISLYLLAGAIITRPVFAKWSATDEDKGYATSTIILGTALMMLAAPVVALAVHLRPRKEN